MLLWKLAKVIELRLISFIRKFFWVSFPLTSLLIFLQESLRRGSSYDTETVSRPVISLDIFPVLETLYWLSYWGHSQMWFWLGTKAFMMDCIFFIRSTFVLPKSAIGYVRDCSFCISWACICTILWFCLLKQTFVY